MYYLSTLDNLFSPPYPIILVTGSKIGIPAPPSLGAPYFCYSVQKVFEYSTPHEISLTLCQNTITSLYQELIDFK